MSQQIALISVSDKTNLEYLARTLNSFNIRIIASGGTSKKIQSFGINVEDVKDITNAPEMLGGRVKTLHPAVHGGILAQDTPSDNADMLARNYDKIDYVICNLYPFESTIAKENVTVSMAVEEVDIGGVTLLRAAAKNHARVTIISDPNDYKRFGEALKANFDETGKAGVSQDLRNEFAVKAFCQTAKYDEMISKYFMGQYQSGDMQLPLRYGANPHQKPAQVFNTEGPLPFKVLSGSPGYINLLDALNSWPLVKELKAALGLPAAASFKHVSPAGAAVGHSLSNDEKIVYGVEDMENLSSLACAYARARGADRMSSFGDWIALSDECDLSTAKIISREVSDGIIAPGYTPEALDILRKKKGGKYCVLLMDAKYEPPLIETRQVYGIKLEQRRNDLQVTDQMFANVVAGESLTANEKRDLIVATIALKYTQSNSVCYAKDGQVVGLGAGQQSRIHCTRLAGDKAQNWWLRFHPTVLSFKWKKTTKRADRANAIDQYVTNQISDVEYFNSLFETQPPAFTLAMKQEHLEKLTGLVVSSDAFFPFPDNIEHVNRVGVKTVAAPSGSVMDDVIVESCKKASIKMVFTPYRLFHH